MTVVGLSIENQLFYNDSIYQKKSNISSTTLELLAEAICYNSTVFPPKNP